MTLLRLRVKDINLLINEMLPCCVKAAKKTSKFHPKLQLLFSYIWNCIKMMCARKRKAGNTKTKRPQASHAS